MVLRGAFAESLKERIESAYASGPWRHGWRLLYSPAGVLDGASVAFIGLNPGGEGEPDGHGVFAMSAGSAYVAERWGDAPSGHARLQRQVQRLCATLEVTPEEMLAGNLVPFRSPDFQSLPDQDRAISFGSGLWTDMLTHVQPRLVVTMGGVAEKAISKCIDARLVETTPSGWGSVKLRRWQGRFSMVALPHLSRYSLFSRADCGEPLLRVLHVARHER